MTRRTAVTGDLGPGKSYATAYLSYSVNKKELMLVVSEFARENKRLMSKILRST